MKKAVVVLGDALGSTAATSSEGAPIEVREVPLANFCCLVQHAESHEAALERFITAVLSGNTAEAARTLADPDSLSPSVQPSIAADLVAAFSDARAELRVNSLACKIHNVCVPDEPFMDRLLAVLDDLSSWPSRLLHACLVHGAIQRC